MTRKKHPRRTARTTPALARIKKMFNTPSYKAALDEWNTAGEAACRALVGGWFNEEYRERRLAEIFDGVSERPRVAGAAPPLLCPTWEPAADFYQPLVLDDDPVLAPRPGGRPCK